MDHPQGAGLQPSNRVNFDRLVRLEFRGAQISSDSGLQAMCVNRHALAADEVPQ